MVAVIIMRMTRLEQNQDYPSACNAAACWPSAFRVSMPRFLRNSLPLARIQEFVLENSGGGNE